MADPLDTTIREVLEEMREKNHVPIGVMAFSMESEKLVIHLFHGVDVAEANALLEKLGLKGTF
jgi:hypothetical protein